MVRTNRKATHQDRAHTRKENQFGYKEGVSTIDAIIKIEPYVEHSDRDAEILPMCRPKAFDTLNRTLLWATLYKKGLPVEMIKHIRRGRQGTRLAPKYKGVYVGGWVVGGGEQETIYEYFKYPQSVRYYS